MRGTAIPPAAGAPGLHRSREMDDLRVVAKPAGIERDNSSVFARRVNRKSLLEDRVRIFTALHQQKYIKEAFVYMRIWTEHETDCKETEVPKTQLYANTWSVLMLPASFRDQLV